MTTLDLEVPLGRAALAEEVRRVRDEELAPSGLQLSWREIGQQLGISRSYASELYDDPLGEKARARKERYRGECVDCGGPTCGGDGPEKAPERCARCSLIMKHEERDWTPATIAAAFRAAAEILGRPPRAGDRMITAPTIRARMSSERAAEGEKLQEAIDAGFRFPAPRTVQRECGSWDAALELAGFAKAPLGRQRYWTREQILLVLRRATEILGRDVLYTDLRTVYAARRWGFASERIREIEHLRAAIAAEGLRVPSPSTVVAEFGNFGAALEALKVELDDADT